MPNTIAPHILLCGGGYVLNRLTQVLPQESFVITSRRSEQVAEWSNAGFYSEVLDIEDKRTLVTLSTKYPSLKVLVDSVPPLKGSSDPLDGVRNLLSLASITRIIYLSSTAVYGEDAGAWVTEKTSPDPATQSGMDRLQSEELYHSAKAEVTALRLSGIYGPTRGLGIALKEGRYAVLKDTPRYTNRIHVDDIVQVLKILLTVTDISYESTYNVSDDAPVLVREVVDYYLEKFSLPAPKALTLKEAQAAGRERLLSSNKRVANNLLKTLPSFHLRYPTYREGAGTEFCDE